MERKSETENSILLPLVNTQSGNFPHSQHSRPGLSLPSGPGFASFGQLTDVRVAERLLRMRRGAAAGFRRVLRPPRQQQRQGQQATSDRPGHHGKANALDFSEKGGKRGPSKIVLSVGTCQRCREGEMELIPAGALGQGAAFIGARWLLPRALVRGTHPLISLFILCNNSLTALKQVPQNAQLLQSCQPDLGPTSAALRVILAAEPGNPVKVRRRSGVAAPPHNCAGWTMNLSPTGHRGTTSIIN